MAVIPPKLNQLYTRFDNCVRCKKAKNPLRHILGGGKFYRPKFLFLFINPTHHNISSHASYAGQRRFPFIGVRYLYRILAEVGFVDKSTVADIYANGWRTEHEQHIERSLQKHGVYITNLVKCTQPHPENPSNEIINEDLTLLQEEITAVQPEYIVAFGKLPIKIMTGKDILLRDCLEAVESKTYRPLASLDMHGKVYKVLPCYFPVGRGNPPKAKILLKWIKQKWGK